MHYDSRMSAYERTALDALVAAVRKRDERKQRVPQRLRNAGRRAGEVVSDNWQKVPFSDEAEQSLAGALRGLQKATMGPAMHSVNRARVVRSYQSDFPEVAELADIRKLDLRECDSRIPRRRLGYGAASAAAGAATSVAVTGAVVSTTVSGGTTAAVAIGALATDVTGTLAGLGRIVAVVAAQYGYDVRKPEEEVFAAGVLAYSLAGVGSSKVSAMTALSRLTQRMMRRATMTELQKHQLVKVLQRLYSSLGLSLGRRKLGQAVPIAGALFNAGLNVELVDRVFRRAGEAYRLRFLTEKYGLDVDELVARLQVEPDDEEDVLRVDELVAEELADESDPPEDEPDGSDSHS